MFVCMEPLGLFPCQCISSTLEPAVIHIHKLGRMVVAVPITDVPPGSLGLRVQSLACRKALLFVADFWVPKEVPVWPYCIAQ